LDGDERRCGVFERERFLMSITVTASWNGAVT